MIDPKIVEAYSQTGGELPYFVGAQQEGGGWLRTIGRFAFPILKRVLNVASNTAEDVIMDEKPILSSLSKRAMEEIGSAMKGKGLPNSMIEAEGSRNSINTVRRKRRMILPPFFNEKEVKRKKK